MATKNRLATPKTLTTPRSTGESSSRPGGGARVIPGHGTLGPRRPTWPPPLPARLRDAHFWGGGECRGPGSPAQVAPEGPPEPSGLAPRAGPAAAAPSPGRQERGGPGGPRVRPQRQRASRAPAGAGGCAALPVPTGEGAGIRHPEPGLLKAGEAGLGRPVAQSRSLLRLEEPSAFASPASPRQRDRNPSPPRFPEPAGRCQPRPSVRVGRGGRCPGPRPFPPAPPHSLSLVSACTPPMRPSGSTWRWKPMPTLQ